MADHKLISTPVSVADGMKRGDRRTWKVLLIAALFAVGFVFLINLLYEKSEPVQWPTPAPAASDEPRTYDVAPPDSVPPPSQPQSGDRS